MITGIITRGWFMLMITVNLLSIDAQQAVSRKCLSGSNKCYKLFRADFTWQEAYDECLHRNQHLTTIQDVQTQSIMEQFAEDQDYPEGAAHAWVAGRRSDDMSWRHLDGTLFSYTGGIGTDGDGSCMALNGAEGLSDTDNLHLAVPCDSHYNPYKAVCEYDETKEVCSSTVDREYQPSVNKCNIVSVERYRSWQDARQYCQSHGWALAHTGAGSWDFYNRLTSTDKQPIGNEAALWIGVQRRSWVWKAGSSQDVYPAVTYWRSGEGLNYGEDCMHIELNDRGLWAEKVCDTTSAYFICQDYQDQPAQGTKFPTTVTTTMTHTPTAKTTNRMATTTLPPLPDQPMNRESCPDCECSLWYIVTGVIGAALLIEHIVFISIFIMRKRHHSNEQTGSSTSIPLHRVNTTDTVPSPDLRNSPISPRSPLNPASVLYEDPGDSTAYTYITTTGGSTVAANLVKDCYLTTAGGSTLAANLVTDEYLTTAGGSNVPANPVSHDYLTLTDDSTVPGHRQNEAYSSLDEQTRVTPAPSVYEAVQRDGDQQYEII